MSTNTDEHGDAKSMTEAEVANLIEYWKQCVTVQTHFNDTSMKVRNFAVVIYSGFLTAVGLSLHNNVEIELFGWHVSAALIFAIAGAAVTQLIHFMDTYWYHVFFESNCYKHGHSRE